MENWSGAIFFAVKLGGSKNNQRKIGKRKTTYTL